MYRVTHKLPNGRYAKLIFRGRQEYRSWVLDMVKANVNVGQPIG